MRENRHWDCGGSLAKSLDNTQNPDNECNRLLPTSRKQGREISSGIIKGTELHATEIEFNAAIIV